MRARGRGLLVVAFASGAAALIYQVVWLRWFGLLFGSTAYAASATLCAFFAGLAGGSAVFGRLAARVRRPLATYAAIEVGAAALALAVPFVFRLYDPIYAALYEGLADRRAIFVGLKFALAFAVMLPPAVLMGGTLPLLATAFVRDPLRLGREGGVLYAVNTLGAAAGSAAAALWLPAAVGVPGSYAVAIGLSLAAAAGAWALGSRGAQEPAAAPASDAAQRAPRALRAVAFASGFGTLALEVLLMQAIAQVFDQSLYSTATVLVVVLLSIAAGAGLVAASEGRVDPRPLLGAALTVEAVLLLVLPAATWALSGLGEAGPARLANGLAVAAVLGAPPLLVGALVLPLVFRLAAGGSVGRRLGGLLAANTLGGIAGSLAASFVLLGGLGLWRSIAAVGAGYGAAALVAHGGARERALRAAVIAGAAVLVLASPASPLRLPAVALEPGDRLVAVESGANGVVSVIDSAWGRRMKLNNHYTLDGAGKLSALKARTGHIPLLLHPDPKRVLFVGSATGSTAAAAVLYPVDEIVLVEIVPEVQEMAARWFSDRNHGVHRDPRTRLVVEDGRNHLRATRERYDVVVADLFSPWNPGIGSMYSREHFEAVRDHLTPDGVFCQWLPLYQHSEATFDSVAATFLSVFPNAAVFRGDFYARTIPRLALCGFRGAPPAVETVDARVRALAARGVGDRWVADPRGFWMLYAGPLAAARDRLAGVPINSDAWPRFEELAGRATNLERSAFLHTRWPAFADLLLAGRDDDGDPFAEALPRARDGAELVRVGALAIDGPPEALRAAWEEARERIPLALLQPPDPSASELWLSR